MSFISNVLIHLKEFRNTGLNRGHAQFAEKKIMISKISPKDKCDF